MKNKKLQIGDKIKIHYFIDNIKIEDYMTITFIDNDIVYTCGHCFSKNSNTDFGKLIYSSGFDTPNEGEEIAMIKIDANKLNLFKQINIGNNFIYKKNIPTLMINNRNKYKGYIISKIENKLKSGWNNLGNGYQINHSITKLNEPYFLVKTNDKLEEEGKYVHGLSGSPWIVDQNGIKLLGSHIGRTKGKDGNGNNIVISYVNPIKIELNRDYL